MPMTVPTSSFLSLSSLVDANRGRRHTTNKPANLMVTVQQPDTKKREDAVNRSGSFIQFAEEIKYHTGNINSLYWGSDNLQLPKTVQCSTRPSQFAKSQMNTGAVGWNVSKRKREWFFWPRGTSGGVKMHSFKRCNRTGPPATHTPQDGTRAKKWNCQFEHCQVCFSPVGLN